jgi:hypothetical protein
MIERSTYWLEHSSCKTENIIAAHRECLADVWTFKKRIASGIEVAIERHAMRGPNGAPLPATAQRAGSWASYLFAKVVTSTLRAACSLTYKVLARHRSVAGCETGRAAIEHAPPAAPYR